VTVDGVKAVLRETAAAYLRGCSFDFGFCPEAGIAPSNIRNTRRRITPETINKSPMRKRPVVSGREERDVNIMFRQKEVQLISQRE
jgi:hypothetical protein